MSLNPELLKLLSAKAGYDVTTPGGANILCYDIMKKTGEPLSLNTVKRITGVLEYEGKHRLDVLDLVARYLDFANWQMLRDFLDNKISEFNTSDKFIDLVSLPAEAEVEICWQPDRRVLIRHIKDNDYVVVQSENSKLIDGDRLIVSEIAVGFPFIVKEVIRGGESLGNYAAAMTAGISAISIL